MLKSEFKSWQVKANNLLDYKFVYTNNNVSARPLNLSYSQINKWTKGILQLVALARTLSLKYCNTLLEPREDWKEVAKLYLNKRRQPAILRPDCIISNGKLMILELNIDSALGGVFEMEQIRGLMEINPLYKGKINNFISPKMAIIQYFKNLNKNNTIRNVAVVGSKHTESWNVPKVQEFCNWINNHCGLKVNYVHPDQLKFQGNNRWMTDGENEYQVIYRYRTLVHPKAQVKEFVDLLKRAYMSSSIVLSDPPDLLIEHKGIIALMSEGIERGIFSQKEQELIQNFIPWTRFLSNAKIAFKNKLYDTRNFCLGHKNLLVLKKIFSHQGDFVYIGDKFKQTEWDNHIENALKQPNQWIIQEKVSSDIFEFGHFDKQSLNNIKDLSMEFVFSPVFFGQYFGGALVRILPNDNSLCKSDNIGLSGVEITK